MQTIGVTDLFCITGWLVIAFSKVPLSYSLLICSLNYVVILQVFLNMLQETSTVQEHQHDPLPFKIFTYLASICLLPYIWITIYDDENLQLLVFALNNMVTV